MSIENGNSFFSTVFLKLFTSGVSEISMLNAFLFQLFASAVTGKLTELLFVCDVFEPFIFPPLSVLPSQFEFSS